MSRVTAFAMRFGRTTLAMRFRRTAFVVACFTRNVYYVADDSWFGGVHRLFTGMVDFFRVHESILETISLAGFVFVKYLFDKISPSGHGIYILCHEKVLAQEILRRHGRQYLDGIVRQQRVG